MSASFLTSQTKENLMKAFAGESQARNRYIFASQTANEQNLYVLSRIFKFTAEQEEQHAKVFFDLLKEVAGNNIDITAGYPADVYTDMQMLLNASVHNENEEFANVYPMFAQTARQEGFAKAASKFELIAKIENIHRERFEYYGNLYKEDKLFKSDKPVRWMCLNCGHIHEATEAPLVCPVCGVRQGYFIREAEAPFTSGEIM